MAAKKSLFDMAASSNVRAARAASTAAARDGGETADGAGFQTAGASLAGSLASYAAEGKGKPADIDIDLIDAHPDNRELSEEHVARLAASIEADGLAQWPLVRRDPQGRQRYQHLAGWHRICAWRLLRDTARERAQAAEAAGDEAAAEAAHEEARRWEKIPCVVLMSCDDERARTLLIHSNIFSGAGDDAAKLSAVKLLKENVEAERAEGKIAKGTRTDEEVARRYTELADGQDSISARTAARMMAKIAAAEKNHEDDGEAADAHGGACQAGTRDDEDGPQAPQRSRKKAPEGHVGEIDKTLRRAELAIVKLGKLGIGKEDADLFGNRMRAAAEALQDLAKPK